MEPAATDQSQLPAPCLISGKPDQKLELLLLCCYQPSMSVKVLLLLLENEMCDTQPLAY